MSGSKYVITIGLFLDNIREAVKIAGGVEKIIVLGMEETPEDCISFLQMVIMDDGSLYDEREPTNVYEDIVVLPFSSGTTGTWRIYSFSRLIKKDFNLQVDQR